jgi:hypothetical protein
MMKPSRRFGAAALLLALAAALAPSPVAAALGERYADPANGFTIRPPQGWEVLPNPAPAPGVSVAFRGPREGALAPSINVAVLPTPLEITPQTLRRAVDEVQAQFGGGAPPPPPKDLAGHVAAISNYRVTNARLVTLYGGTAGFMESSYDQGAGGDRQPVRNFQVIASGIGCHYVITYTSPADGYDRFVKEAHDSVNTFTAGAAPAGGGKPPRWTDYGRPVGATLGLLLLIGFMVFLWRRAERRRRR